MARTRSSRTRKRKGKNPIADRLGNLRKKFRKALVERIKKNPGKALVIALGALAVIILLVAYAVRPAEQIDSGAYTHAAVFDNCIPVDGIDVSYAQGSVDWSEIKKVGIDFAFIRAGFRDTGKGNLHVDERFEENIAAAKRAGLAVGVYYFSQATTVKEARAEANALLELVEPYRIDLPLIMDYERSGNGRLTQAISSGELGRKRLGKIVRAWTGTVEDAGYDSGLYANYDFLTHYLNGAALSKTTNVWTAQYNSYAQFDGDYRFWQCTDSLQLEGTESTHVDRDFWYVPYSGVWESNASDADERFSIGDCDVELKRQRFRYMGRRIEPKFKIKDGLRTLRENRDYTVTYVDNTAPGQAYAIIRGIGRYKDTISAGFVIKHFIF